MDFRELFDRLLCTVTTARCVLCGEVVEYDDYWCGRCDCAQADNTKLDDGILCALCYTGTARDAILRIKRQRDLRTFRFFAIQMERVMTRSWGETHFDMLVPVPMTAKKHRERGFNQAELLARALGALIGAPVNGQVLLRVDSSGVQHRLGKLDREKNARLSYRLQDADSVADKRILLVDDVLTTGTSLGACAGLLAEAGASEVCTIAATYTPLRQGASASGK